jgi:5-methylcytosine-specific restriction protein A
MKLGNFSALDPQYEGKGLWAGARLDREVWDEFADATYRLRAAADAIRSNFTIAEPPSPYEAEEEEFSEGRILTWLHNQRERRPEKVRQKKRQVLDRDGKLACEACGFDFVERYGPLGAEFAECHHRVPLAELAEGQKLKLSDLAILCANCHRMIHRSAHRGPMLSVEQLRELVDSHRPPRVWLTGTRSERALRARR